MEKPRVVDLFCGAGGFSLGFHAAGCRIDAGVDFDEAAGLTFRRNFSELQDVPPAVRFGDEGNLEELDLGSLVATPPDILIGGPPCQGFSRVGRGKLQSLSDESHAKDARNGLYKRFLDAAELWKPRAIVMENVPGMLSVEGRSVADEASADLSNRGYQVGYAALNAAWYGVPQYRERLFFVGFRRDLGIRPALPPTTHIADLRSGYVRPEQELFLPFEDIHTELDVDARAATRTATSVGEALGDLAALTDHLSGAPAPRGDFRRRTPYRGAARLPYARLMRQWPGFKSRRAVVDHVIRRTPRDYGTFARMNPGDRYAEALAIARVRFHEELEALRSEAPAIGTIGYEELERRYVPPYPVGIFKDKWRKLVAEQPSWTIPAHLSKDAYSHIHYDGEQARAISIREAARIQSFPDGFQFHGNMGDCFRQIGNAVPPLLSWAVATEVLKRLGLRPTLPEWGS